MSWSINWQGNWLGYCCKSLREHFTRNDCDWVGILGMSGIIGLIGGKGVKKVFQVGGMPWVKKGKVAAEINGGGSSSGGGSGSGGSGGSSNSIGR